ncbi:uncharacterized protein [Chironomus tepperi]|uniref:uncharacterized protein n=1 Tax=Chironomus tepperi TaxID=113505 RepID=UPI00391F487E
MKIFIVLACVLAVVAAQQGKKPKEDKKSKNSICSKQLSVNATTCCPGMPTLQQFFDQCAAQCKAMTNTSEPTAQGKRGGKGAKQEKGKKERKDDGKEQMHKCVMPCVLQAANVLGPDGNISSDALNAALSASASSVWANIVPNVITDCFANATVQADKPFHGKSEKHKDEFCFNGNVLKCVFKNLYLSCPSSVLVSSSDCTDLTAKMSQCPCEGDEKEHKGGDKKEKKEKEGGKGGKGEKNEKQGGNKEGKGKPTTQATLVA